MKVKRQHPQLRQIWGIVHDIYWRCRWGNDGKMLTKAQRAEWKRIHDEAEALIEKAGRLSD